MKMNFKYTIALLGLALISCSMSLHIDCTEIRNGKFYYFSKVGRHKVFVERTGDLQIEKDLTDGKILRNKIAWQTDCRFTMFVNASSQVKLSGSDSLLSTIPVRIEIINIQAEYYICLGQITYKEMNINIQLRDTLYFNR